MLAQIFPSVAHSATSYALIAIFGGMNPLAGIFCIVRPKTAAVFLRKYGAAFGQFDKSFDPIERLVETNSAGQDFGGLLYADIVGGLVRLP